jgi:hypothetical protein
MVAFQIHAVLFIIPLKFLILHEISIAFCYTNIKPWGLLPSESPPAGGNADPLAACTVSRISFFV